MPTTTNPVVAAVGRRGSTAAVAYAADEAVRQHRDLHLVHAVELDVSESESADVIDRARLLAAERVVGRVAVTSETSLAPTVPAVVAAARDAWLLVVGRCPESVRTHPYVRSVTGGLASRALVPVLSVPDDWSDATGSPHVVVGIDDPGLSDEVLLEAFVAARTRHARLTIISTWWRPTGAGDRPLTQVDDLDRPERVRAGLDELTASLSGAYPDVPFDLQVFNRPPGDALIEASADATLMLLGRHDSLLATGSHLGPVARAVLREATCPVLLATPRRTHHVQRSGAQQELLA